MISTLALMHAKRIIPATRYNSLTSLKAFSTETEQPQSWMPSWLRSRLPAFAGGSAGELQELDLDTYHKSLRNARRMGALTGFAHGTAAAKDPVAQGTLRLQESIIEAMLPEERNDLSSFTGTARQRVAGQVSCTVQQVDDCIAKYLWMQTMVQRMAERKKRGLAMPTSMTEVEDQLGTWQQYRTAHPDMETTAPAGSILVSSGTLEPRTKQPCPLANKHVSRNTRCPLTQRRYKQCCGK